MGSLTIHFRRDTEGCPAPVDDGDGNLYPYIGTLFDREGGKPIVTAWGTSYMDVARKLTT